jgi:hypothetical protein
MIRAILAVWLLSASVALAAEVPKTSAGRGTTKVQVDATGKPL